MRTRTEPAAARCRALGVLRRPQAARFTTALPTVPLTGSVVLLVLLATLAVHSHPADLDEIVAWSSTNVHNLAHHPLAALLVSAFVVPGNVLPQLTMVAIGLAMVERALGSRGAFTVAAGGHLIATLLTEYGAEAASRLQLIATSSPYRSDVGISYVMFAVLGAASCLLTGRARILAALAMSGWVAVPFLRAPAMTTTGHLLSLVTGAAIMCWLRRYRQPTVAASSAGGQPACPQVRRSVLPASTGPVGPCTASGGALRAEEGPDGARSMDTTAR